MSPSEKEITIYTKNNEKMDSFIYPYYPNTTKYALNLTRDKFKAEEHFQSCGFKTTKSRMYDYSDSPKAKLEFFQENKDERVVIKPLNSSLGKGVFVNVSQDRFLENWELSKKDLSVSELRNEEDLKFIVQNYIQGFETRVTILQGTIVALVARIPPYIKGNGKQTIKELIEEKNREREACKYLGKHPIKITNKIKEFLISQDKSLDYVPKFGEYVLLSSVSNIVGGGEIINITDKVSFNVKDFALNVLASIPGIYSGGLDIILKSFEDTDPYILEVNTYPVISLTKYPTYGEPSNPSKVLFDSLISQYQVGRKNENNYEIENSDMFVRDFIDFTKRKLNYIK